MDPLASDDPAALGPYTLQGRLGSGGMGTVYLGRSQGGRLVAVKTVHEWLARDPEFRTRFEREVDAARRVNGLYTAQVVDADPYAATPWMATRYINGPSVADRVNRSGPFTVAEVVALAGGVAEALASIHAAGLVHRDLKPSNVILADDGPHVIDFGVAQARDLPGLTATGKVIGTFEYMAPEQVESGIVGPASDVFALGGLLYFAATGRPPFGSGSALYLINQLVHGEPDLAAVADPRLRSLVASCLAKNPDARPLPEAILRTAAALDPAATIGPPPQPSPPFSPPSSPSTPPPSPSTPPPSPSTPPPSPSTPPPSPSTPPPSPRPAPPQAFAGHAFGQGFGPNAAAWAEPVTSRGPAGPSTPPVGPPTPQPARPFLGAPPPRPAGPSTPPPMGPTPGPPTPPPVALAGAPLPDRGGRSGPSRRALLTGAGIVLGAGALGGAALVERALVSDARKTSTQPAAPAVRVLTGNHTEMTMDVVFFRDGKTAAACCSENVHLVDVASAETRRVVNSGSGSVYAVALRPDQTWLAEGCSGGQTELRDATTGELVRSIAVNTQQVNGVEFSRDGSRLVISSSDGTVKIVDPGTGQATLTLTVKGAASDATFAPDGKHVATATKDGDVRIWDAVSGKPQLTLTGHTGAVWAVAYSPDGRYVLTAGDDNAGRIYEAATGKAVRSLTGHTAPVSGIAVSPDGATVATASSDGSARLWTLATGSVLHVLNGHNGFLQQAAWSADGRTVATTGEDGTVRFWDPTTGRQLAATKPLPGVPWDVAVGPDGAVATVGGKTVRVVEPATGAQRQVLTADDLVFEVRWAPSGRQIAATSNTALYLWNPATATPTTTVKIDTSPLCLAYAPDSASVAVGDSAGAVRLWNAGTGSAIKALQVGAKQTKVRALGYDPNGKTLAVATDDAKLQLWDVASGKPVRAMASTAYVLQVAFLADGRLVTSNEAGQVEVWNTTTGQRLSQFAQPTVMMYGLAISPDGKTVAGGGADGVVLLWSLGSGQKVKTLTGHQGRILGLDFTPDGRYLASVAGDATCRIWDLTADVVTATS